MPSSFNSYKMLHAIRTHMWHTSTRKLAHTNYSMFHKSTLSMGKDADHANGDRNSSDEKHMEFNVSIKSTCFLVNFSANQFTRFQRKARPPSFLIILSLSLCSGHSLRPTSLSCCYAHRFLASHIIYRALCLFCYPMAGRSRTQGWRMRRHYRSERILRN